MRLRATAFLDSRVFSMLFNRGVGKEAGMSGRDFFLVASTAAISSLLTYVTLTTLAAPLETPRTEISAPVASRAAPSLAVGEDRHAPQGDPALQHSSPPAASSQSGIQPPQDPARAIQKQQELGAQFSGLFRDGNMADTAAVNARLEDRFYQEEWNQEWAGSKEKSIRTLFEANQDLGGMTPLQVTCRSKNCQVVLAAAGQEQARQLSAKFMQAATRADVGMKDKVVSFFPDVATGRVVFYLSENGNTDLFQ